MTADGGLRRTLSSLRTETAGDAVSSTTIREELSARHHCPLGEKAKSKASPPGNAADELVVVEMMFIIVRRGRKYATNKFRLISCQNLLFNCGKLSSVKGPGITLLLIEKEGHLER